jgi:hypothetical protein
MDGDVECRFAVFLQLHCAVKVEFERRIFNRIHDVARLGQCAKSADFERSPALSIARSIVTHGEVCGGGTNVSPCPPRMPSTRLIAVFAVACISLLIGVIAVVGHIFTEPPAGL